MSAVATAALPVIGGRPRVSNMGGRGKTTTFDPKSNSLRSMELLGDSAKMPVSNDENRVLEEDLIMDRRKLLRCTTEIENIQQKMEALHRLMDNARMDLNESRNLLRAKMAAVETEQHLFKVAKDESQKVMVELKRLEAEMKEKQTQYDLSKVMLEKQRKTLENLEKNKQMDRKQFEAIVYEIGDTDGLNITMQKYLIMDEKVSAELSAKLSKLCVQLATKTRDLEGTVSELKSVDMALAKAGADFQKEQSERNGLLRQWEQAVELLQKRDDDMETVRGQVEKCQNEELNWKDAVNEKEAEVRDQRAADIELRRNIGQLNQQLAKLRTTLVKRETDLQQKRDRLATVKALADSEKAALKSEMLHVAQLKEQVETNRKKLDATVQWRLDKQKQVEGGKLQNETVDNRKLRLDKEIRMEEHTLENMERRKKTLMGQIIKKKEMNASGKKEQAQIQADYEVSKSIHRNLSIQMKHLEKEIGKQMRIISGKDAEIQRLERQVEQAQSTGGKEYGEIAAFRQKVESRRTLLVEKEATEQTWTSTIKLCQMEIEKARKQLDKLTLSRQELENVKSGHESEMAVLESRLKQFQVQRQEAVVQCNLQKAQVKRLQDVLENRTAEVNSVEEAKEAQRQALQTQESELKHRRNELQLKCLQAEEERKKLGMRVNDVQGKVNNLMSRYDAYIRGLPFADESSPVLEDVLNKKSKERAELEKIHAELSEKLTKAEKEVAALQNTMRLINERNETFRQAVMQADRNSAEYQEKLLLEAQYQALTERYREIRHRIKEFKEKTKGLKDKSIDTERKLIRLDIDSKHDEDEIDRLKSEIPDQQNKLDRWRLENEKVQKEFERVSSARKKQFVRDDIDLQSVMSLNIAAGKALSELAKENSDVTGLMADYCMKTGLELESPSDSGVGSALTRRSTVLNRSVKNGTAFALYNSKLDVQTLPPIASKGGKTLVRVGSHSLPRSQANGRAT